MAENELVNKFESWKNRHKDEFYIDIDSAKDLCKNNFNLNWLKVQMKDYRGDAIINLKTGEIGKERFSQINYFNQDENLVTVGILASGMRTLFNPLTKELFNERFSNILPTNLENIYLVKMLNDKGATFFNAKTKQLFDERFKNICGTNSKNIYIVEMNDGSGKTLFNLKTKQILNERFENMFPSENENIYYVEMFDFVGETLFNAETKQVLENRFKNINATKFENLYCVSMLLEKPYSERYGITQYYKTLFNLKTKEVFKERFKDIVEIDYDNIFKVILKDDSTTLFNAKTKQVLDESFKDLKSIGNKEFIVHKTNGETGFYNLETKKFKPCEDETYTKYMYGGHIPETYPTGVSDILEITNANDLLYYIEEHKTPIKTPAKKR